MEILLKKPIIKNKTCPIKEYALPEKLTENLAELIGIHFGDGSMRIEKKKDYRLSYCFNINEKKLRERTKSLYYSLFGINLREKEFPKKGSVDLWCFSKQVCYFLYENFGVPFGKKERLKVPTLIKENSIFLKGFIRGLFSTDGCFYFKKRDNIPVIKLTNKSLDFAREVSSALNLMGFNFNYCLRSKANKNLGCDVVLTRKKQIKKFVHEIGYFKEYLDGRVRI